MQNIKHHYAKAEHAQRLNWSLQLLLQEISNNGFRTLLEFNGKAFAKYTEKVILYCCHLTVYCFLMPGIIFLVILLKYVP